MMVESHGSLIPIPMVESSIVTMGLIMVVMTMVMIDIIVIILRWAMGLANWLVTGDITPKKSQL